MLQIVDTHTGGEPTRIVVGGLPRLPGKTMIEKWEYAQEHWQHLRTFLMHEPRGHNDMFGAFLVPPTDPDADYGVLFCDGGGFLTMCGHGSMGVGTALVALGTVTPTPPVTSVKVEAPAGMIELEVATDESGRAGEVTVKNVPSFVYRGHLQLQVPGFDSPVDYSIAFGGNFFAIMDIRQFGLTIRPEHAHRIQELGIAVRDQINAEVTSVHPEHPSIKDVKLVEFYEPGEGEAPTRNAVVFGEGQVDRSPCGTGTSAKMALLVREGKLQPGEEFVYEAITGSRFYGRLETGPTVGDYKAYTPYIRGRAFVTAFSQFFVDPEDPLKDGFRLG
ncbi:MAG: proline racemase family protein [Synergistales bacterium]|nr:proline racemase family protein [Synergistales bacterium]